jgi:hypothetical protein
MSASFCFFRTNFFRVNDAEAFRVWVIKHRFRLLTSPKYSGLFGLMPNPPDNELSSSQSRFETSQDFEGELASFLADDAVAVIHEIGYDGDYHVFGDAVAIRARHQPVRVSLEEVYFRAAKMLGVPNASWTGE